MRVRALTPLTFSLVAAAVLVAAEDRPWAVVTGASGGLGACIAREAGRNGFNVLLAARRRDRLSRLADEIERSYEVSAATCPCDLSRADGVLELQRASAAHDVRLAVLNAGVCRQGDLCRMSSAQVEEMLCINVASQSSLLQHFAQQMSGAGHGGHILVVASSAAAAPGVPGVAVYAASKSFLRSLCDAVGAELRRNGGGVTVTCALPSAIDTEFQAASGLATAKVFTLPGVRRLPGGVVLSAEAVAKTATTAALRGRPEIVPGLLPRAFVGLSDRRLLPRPLARAIAAFCFSTD